MLYSGAKLGMSSNIHISTTFILNIYKAWYELWGGESVAVSKHKYSGGFFPIRDQSSSATYYYKEDPTIGAKRKPPALHKEWIFYRKLKPDENELSLRRQQVFIQIF